MITGDDLVAMIEILNLGGNRVVVVADGKEREVTGAEKGASGVETVIRLVVN